jgi:drug/metabolite transporter (DMT)-like permease
MLLGVCLWSLYSWLLARPPASMRAPQRPGWDWAQFLLLQVLFGVGWSLLAAGVEQAVAPQPIVWSPWVAALLLYVAIGPSVIAFRCWGIGVAEAGPTLAAFFSNLSPLFAAALSALLVGEAPQPYHGVAFALVVAGIVISSRR